MDPTRERKNLGSPTKLNFTIPMQTRGGSDIRLYEIFESSYINGAYYVKEEDKWYPVQWHWNGYYNRDGTCSLDLINVPEQQEKIYA